MVDDTYMVNMSDTSDLRSLPIYISADKPVADSPFFERGIIAGVASWPGELKHPYVQF